MKLIKPSERALKLSSKISVRCAGCSYLPLSFTVLYPLHQIRINVDGMLSMQYMIETSDGKVTFLEYLVRCVEDSLRLALTADELCLQFQPLQIEP